MKRREITVFILGVITIILPAEIFLRIINFRPESSWQPSGTHKIDDSLIYINTPNYSGDWITEDFQQKTFINSTGFRDEQIKTKKPEIKRIIVVGDSFIFGHGISSNKLTIPAQLENKIAGVDVINAGVQGYSPDQEYRFITGKAMEYEPDFIIWALNPHDYDNMTYFPSLYDLDKRENLKKTSAMTTWIYFKGFLTAKFPVLLQKSYLFLYILDSLEKIPLLNRGLMIPHDKRYDWIEKKLSEEVKSVIAFTEKNELGLVMVFLPLKYSYRDNKYNSQYVNYEGVVKSIKKILDGENIIYVDIGLDLWRQAQVNKKNSQSDYNRLFFKNDYHLNEAGAEIAAEMLADKLELEKLFIRNQN